MGAYLNKPVTKKESELGENGRVRYAASCMQGWRLYQEDAHNCILDFTENCSLFAVYDGHGGCEVAQYTALHLPCLLKEKGAWKSGDYAKAIEEAFLEFDDILRSEKVLKELKAMAATSTERHHESSDDEDKQALYEEANMPLESLLENYGFVIRRDVSGKPVIDVEELLRERSKKSAKSTKNGDSAMDSSETEESKVLEESTEERLSVSSAVNGQISEEKIKKRVCQSPIDGNPKRTRSGLETNSENITEASNSECIKSDSANDSKKVSVVSETCSSESSNTCVTETVVVKKLAVEETEGADGCKKVISDEVTTSVKATKSPLEMELDRDDNEGTSESASSRQIDDENKAQSSTAAENQAAMSSDSEQSFDEDYKEEDELSEEDEEDEESEPDEEPCYNGPSGDTPGEDSGTTACLDKIIVGNAGDSRAVLCRKGEAIELSRDHKPENPAEETRIEAAGGVVSVDGRVNGGLNLSRLDNNLFFYLCLVYIIGSSLFENFLKFRALGDHFYKKNTNLPLKDQMISALPDITENTIGPDDEFVVVACDGIWNSLTSQDVVDFVRGKLAENLSLKEICEKMCDDCLSPNTAGDGTGCDNMTIIIVELRHP